MSRNLRSQASASGSLGCCPSRNLVALFLSVGDEERVLRLRDHFRRDVRHVQDVQDGAVISLKDIGRSNWRAEDPVQQERSGTCHCSGAEIVETEMMIIVEDADILRMSISSLATKVRTRGSTTSEAVTMICSYRRPVVHLEQLAVVDRAHGAGASRRKSAEDAGRG